MVVVVVVVGVGVGVLFSFFPVRNDKNHGEFPGGLRGGPSSLSEYSMVLCG